MSTERTRKMHRLAALDGFREQRARQAFVSAKATRDRREEVEAMCLSSRAQHLAGVDRLLGSPVLDVSRYALAGERLEVAAGVAAAATQEREAADGLMAEASNAWNLRRLMADASVQRAEGMTQEDERSALARSTADLLDLWIARRPR